MKKFLLLGWIIPSLQKVVKNYSIECDDCFLPEFSWRQIVLTFPEKEFCAEPGKFFVNLSETALEF